LVEIYFTTATFEDSWTLAFAQSTAL
jgi:hypothetical protein